jgi:hypothetical protein
LEACCVSRTATPILLHGSVGTRSVSLGGFLGHHCLRH